MQSLKLSWSMKPFTQKPLVLENFTQLIFPLKETTVQSLFEVVGFSEMKRIFRD